MTAVGRPKANHLVVPVAERVDPIDRRLALVVPTIDLSHYYRTPWEQVGYFVALVAAMALRPAVVPRDPLVTATEQHPRAVVRPRHLDCPMLRAVAERALVPPRRRAAVERDLAHPRRRAVEERTLVLPMLRAAAGQALVPPRRQAAVERDSERPMLRPVVVRPSLRAAAGRPRH